jgi:SAM-dependent methyltransferase
MINLDDPLTNLIHWYRSSPAGRRIAQLETECMQRLLEDSFGYDLLQIGPLEHIAASLTVSRIHHRIITSETRFAVTECNATWLVRVQASPMTLPFASETLDAIVLPHTLEWVSDPRQLLCEVERVLIPEGRIFLLGFNPISPWGLWRYRRRYRLWLTPWRVSAWLTMLGLSLELREYAFFTPTCLCRDLDWCERVGRNYWPIFGGLYAIRAVKRVTAGIPPRQILTRWPTRTLIPASSWFSNH